MNSMRSGNPVLQNSILKNVGGYVDRSNAMTIQGTVVKSIILLLCILLTAGYTWTVAMQSGPAAVTPWLWGGLITGLILAFATIFKKEWAPITAPLYALAEGLFLGGISAVFEVQYPGIVIQAVGLTFGVLAVMLFAYETGWIRPTEKFVWGVVAATGGIALFYFVAIMLSFFGINMGMVFGNGLFGIAFSVFVVCVAALNLIIDFGVIEQGASRGLPKFMEWYGAFALMVTLVWLYLEILRLLSKLRSR
jgi:uncharacterized YccA/Bax inhibitor family protein